MTTIAFVEYECTLSSGPLRVRRAGAGRPVVHLHSAAGLQISQVLEALADHHAVHAPIVPGLDDAPRHANVKSIPQLAHLIAEYIQRECGGQCDIVGESFGGWIGLWLAVLHPDLVSQLILLAPAGLRPQSKGGLPEEPGERHKALYAKPERAPVETRNAQVLLANRKSTLEYSGGVAFDEELARRLPEIRARTLILMGALDRVIPIETGHLLKAQIPSSHLTYIWDAAHALAYDQPQRVAALMLDFIDRGESFLVRPALSTGM